MLFQLFTTPDSPYKGPREGETALMKFWKYFRFASPSFALAMGIPLYFIGGDTIFYYVAFLGALALFGDYFFGEDTEEWAGAYKYTQIFPLMEVAAILSNSLLVILFAWQLGFPSFDLFGIGALVQFVTGFDVAAAFAANSTYSYLGGFGLAVAGGTLNGVVLGHNTTHRTFDAKSVWMGRFGEAFGLFTYFSVRHPYGHHNLIGTPADPSWAHRGESFYHFRMRSVWGQYKMTWALEKQRLEKYGLPTIHWTNQALQGWAIEILVLGMFFYTGGLMGVAAMILIGLIAHTGLELANYIEHQGLCRVPAEPFQPRHAWDDAHRMTYWAVWAISRHSHHHSDAQVEEPELNFYGNTDKAMSTPYGYLVSFLLVLLPPVWNKIMTPRYLEWDENYASPEERDLAAHENMNSGIPELIEAGFSHFNNKFNKAEEVEVVLDVA
ncbi:MAG: fatty acid desaturase [Pseudomonadales bacterium]|nr:fatty acid desaturase [Pseudomonadales bacterium]